MQYHHSDQQIQRRLEEFDGRKAEQQPGPCSGGARERLAVRQQEQRKNQRLHQPRKKNRREVDPHQAGKDAPRRKHDPVGQRRNKLTHRIAERRAQQLHVEPQEQNVNDEPEYIQDQQVGDLDEHHSFPSSSPSSLPRSLAAWIARMIASFTSSLAMLASARSVVPPLEVTRSRSTATGSGLVEASLAAPVKVFNTSWCAIGTGSPSSRAASSTASMK